jgi:hypothetical protein
MRDGDSAHGNPGEPAGDRNALDSDTDVGDTNNAPASTGPEREEGFEELREEFEGEGRPSGRGEEAERPAERASDRGLPIRNYNRLTVPEIIRQTQKLHLPELKAILEFERANRRRKTLIAELARVIGEEGGSK